jgi:histidinol-phosphatase (PHP family)
MALVTDFHSHIVRSSPTQMIQSAHEKGIRILGLSEHVFQMHEARSPLEHMPLEGPMLTIPEYFTAVRAASEQAPIDVRIGLEVDFVPDKNAAIQQPLQGHPWDFLIGSIHEVDGEQFEQKRPLSRDAGQQRWLRYYQLLREAVNSGYFSLISHPVRMRTANPYIPDTLDEELQHLAAEATRNNVALEINGYDLRSYPTLVRRLAQVCATYHTPISVGSDAHNPTQVAQSHQATTSLLRDLGITHVRIWKQQAPEEYEI